MKWKWLAVAAAALLLVLGGLTWFWLVPWYHERQIDPYSLLNEALHNTAGAHSFRYNLQSYLLVDGRREVISSVAGERSRAGNIHIKGEMVKTPVDIYHVDKTIYNWDSFSKRWLVIDDPQSNSTRILISELDPLANFNFKSIGEISLQGFEKVAGRRCAVIYCKPSVENELLEILWKDFVYKIKIDIKDKVIREASLSATSKSNSGTSLSLKVSFTDYNKDISIKKPDIH